MNKEKKIEPNVFFLLALSPVTLTLTLTHILTRSQIHTHIQRYTQTLTNHISIVRLHSDTYKEKEKRKKTESKAVLIAENQAKTGTEIDRQT